VTTPHPPRPTLTRAEGLHVWDAAGRRYLDATSGAFCMQLGYTRPDLVSAMADAATRLSHARPSRFDSEAAAGYRESLVGAAGAPYTRAIIASSGSEAVEIAIKAAWWWQRARGASGRKAVLSLSGHYHGATLGALSATGLPARRAPYEPWLDAREFGPAAHCARCFRGLTHPACDVACAEAALDRALTAAAFLAETVPAAGLAAAVPPPGWIERVRARCDEAGALWIADEVLTGFGRAGALFAWSRLVERDGSTAAPDIVVFGKGASAGFFPVSGVLLSERVAAALDSAATPFGQAQTFGESPIGAAVAHRALEAYASERIFERVREREGEAAAVFGPLRERESVLEVRGIGLLWGIELATAGPDRAPFPNSGRLAREVEAGCRTRGVLVHGTSGFLPDGSGDAVLVAPPLVAERSDLARIADALGEAIDAAAPAGGRKRWVEEWEDR
jgi:adenosylmethionine-8-amino-7-oxononanoate aminotransferase